LRAGADKVSINTAAINNPEFIREASRSFGSSTIVVAIEAIKQPDGAYLAFVDNGREYTGVEVIQWAKRVEELGAGEIMLTSVDREGTGKGFDTFLTKAVSDVVSIPVIAHGGCGKKEDIKDIIVDGHSDAVAVSSMIHYEYLSKVRNIEGFEAEGNIDFLKSGDSYNKVSKANIREIKTYLRDNNIECRFE
ncbi:MAG: HisA/HisF-related TIM barrel protein, partial [bacterium]